MIGEEYVLFRKASDLHRFILKNIIPGHPPRFLKQSRNILNRSLFMPAPAVLPAQNAA